MNHFTNHFMNPIASFEFLLMFTYLRFIIQAQTLHRDVANEGAVFQAPGK